MYPWRNYYRRNLNICSTERGNTFSGLRRKHLIFCEEETRETIADLAEKPIGLAIHKHRCVKARRSWRHCASKIIAIRSVQWGMNKRRRYGEAARIHQPARERAILRQIERRIPEYATDLTLGRDEVGRSCRIQDIFVCRVFALAGIGVDKLFRRLALQNELELPGEIFCVLHAAVGAARAKWGNTVCRVAREQHPTMAKTLHTQAGKCIDAAPFQLELGFLSE